MVGVIAPPSKRWVKYADGTYGPEDASVLSNGIGGTLREINAARTIQRAYRKHSKRQLTIYAAVLIQRWCVGLSNVEL